MPSNNVKPVAQFAAAILFPWALHAADPVKDIDGILDRFALATGGKAAWAKIQSRQTTAEMETLGASGEWVLTAKAPNLSLAKLSHPKIGGFESGFDGTAAWTRSAQKVGLKTGADLARAKREAEFFAELNLKSSFPGLAFVGTEPMKGESASILESKDPQLGKDRFYFGESTGLLLRRESSFVNPEGKQMGAETSYSDYREVDGIRYPHRQEVPVRIRGEVINESKVRVKEIRHNLPFEDALFKVPAH